ncbi:hypothetical protein [Reyranella sp.]|uniref:hypothetical protein n=1 Tax=Reyranella sp. TaxID=1929291 RepID=UPI002730EB3D|nr:hypothetical protein [Reyranella sp.]MDP2377193.1 hypothetical protein [Reyranella sp.]
MPQHHIYIDPSDDLSWINWGKLIYKWLDPKSGVTPPGTVEALQIQWKDNGVLAEFRGDKTRGVLVEVYDPGDTSKDYVISLPTKKMVDDDHAFLKRIYQGSKKYPTPDWYTRIYEGNPSKKPLGSEDEMTNIGFARLGEYVINECM